MLRRLLVPFLLLFAFSAALHAQAGFGEPLPDASVGVPYSFDFGAALMALIGTIPPDAGVTFTFSFGVTGGAGLPPGLSLQSDGLLSGTPTTAGPYTFSIDIGFHVAVQGQPVFDETVPIPEFLTVGGTSVPTTVDPGGLTFAFNQGSTSPVSKTITLTNRGGQAKTFSATASANSSAKLSVSPGSGSLNPFATSSVLVTVDPTGLPAGTVVGKVSFAVSPSGETFDVSVLITLTSSQQSIVVSQTGLRFQTVVGGGAPPSQAISVLNGGAGSLSFAASASTVSGGNWLSVSPTGGSSSSSSGASITVSVNPAGLAAGDYYGQIQFTSGNAANSPQIASVVLNVFTPDKSPGALVTTTGLIFVAQAGGANPAAKTISISNPSPAPITFNAAVFASPNFFTVQPQNGTVNTGQPTAVSVQPSLTGLTTGVYRGEVDLVFKDGSIRRIAILLIVIPAIGSSSAGSLEELAAIPLAAGCTPNKLIPVFTLLGTGFEVTAGWPTAIEATIVDNCGTFMKSGSVVAAFSSGDPALSLSSLQDGRWTATWQPRNTSSSQVTITVTAQQAQPALQGSEQIGGGLQPNTAVPIIGGGAVVSAASNTVQQPLAPGAFISIYGQNFSQGLESSTTLPYATKLAGAQVVLAGKALPLQFASTNQINAIVPFDVPPNTTQQLIVLQGSAISVPEPVTIAPAQPAIFTADLTPRGPGIIDVYKPDGTHLGIGQPASAGYVIVIYCSGLGAVDPPVAAGVGPPQSSKTVNDVTATIGGIQAQVVFSGVVAGFAGLYQVNVNVPSGVTPGDSVPVVLTVAGQQSVPVTIKVQ
jgi:trimeric autotransporter adhesin